MDLGGTGVCAQGMVCPRFTGSVNLGGTLVVSQIEAERCRLERYLSPHGHEEVVPAL